MAALRRIFDVTDPFVGPFGQRHKGGHGRYLPPEEAAPLPREVLSSYAATVAKSSGVTVIEGRSARDGRVEPPSRPDRSAIQGRNSSRPPRKWDGRFARGLDVRTEVATVRLSRPRRGGVCVNASGRPPPRVDYRSDGPLWRDRA